MPNKKEDIIEEFLKNTLKKINLTGIKSWNDLKLLGQNNLKEISLQLQQQEGNLESILKKLEDLREDEGQILADMVGKTISKEDNLRDLINLNQLHLKKILNRLKAKWFYELISLYTDFQIKFAPYLPQLRPKKYLQFFRSEAVIYLPAIYDSKELENIPEKWALAFVDVEDNSDENQIFYTFEFDLLKSGNYSNAGIQDFKLEADIYSAEIYSLSEFYVLHTASRSNRKFFDLWCQNLNLDDDINLEELRKAFHNGKIAGERKKRPFIKK